MEVKGIGKKKKRPIFLIYILIIIKDNKSNTSTTSHTLTINKLFIIN